MIQARTLRNKEALRKISNLPGYYKWWAAQSELDVILKALNIQFSDIENALEIKDGLYCIYVGIAVKESVRARLDWHVNDKHTASQVLNGTLSTLRQSISSIVSGNQFDKESTDNFIDKLYIEYFYCNEPIKSETAKIKLHETEKQLLTEYLRVLNIQENHHPLSIPIKIALKELRKQSKSFEITKGGTL